MREMCLVAGPEYHCNEFFNHFAKSKLHVHG
jgi:hypothetical protein